MKASRREFLHRSTLAAASICLGAQSAHAEIVPDEKKSTMHRHLLFDGGDIPRILKTVQHPRFVEYWKSMKDADLVADTKFLRDELRLNNHVKDMLRARQVLERSSFVYRLTEDKRHLDVARHAVDRI